jgi:hypothetical protein
MWASRVMTPDWFPDGNFKSGDSVQLKDPGEYAHVFDNPKAAMEVIDAFYFRHHAPPTYALREPGGSICVTSFHDEDLVPCSPAVAEQPVPLGGATSSGFTN